MSEFAVHVTTNRGDLADDDLDDLVDALATHAAVPSLRGGRLSVQLTVQARSLAAACAAGVKLIGSYGEVVAVEVQTAEEFERGFDVPVTDLVSTTEVAEILGVARQRVLQLVGKPGFPEPVRLGGRGLHFSRSAVGRFESTWTRRPGPKQEKTSAV